MSEDGEENGRQGTRRQLPNITTDFLSLYMTKSSTTPNNEAGLSAFSSPRGSFRNGVSPPALAFSPSPNKMLEDVASPNSSFCHRLNVDECVAYLDQEVTVLGFSSLFNKRSGTLDITNLINCVHGLLEKYQSGLKSREELENSQRRNESDIENLQLSQQRLKELLTQRDRDIQQALESERQMKEKVKRLTDLLKAEKDEVKRLTSVIQHKDAQYKHELKKKEREHHKLKENLQSRRTDRNSERKAGMEISEALQRPEGKRARWKTQDKHDDDLYKTVILDYEEKHKELLAENAELRQCLRNVQKEITNATSQPNLDNSLSMNDSDDISDLESVNSLQSEYEVSDGFYEMPFPMLRAILQKSLKKRLKHIRMMNKHIYNQGEMEQTVPKSPTVDRHEIDRLKKQVERYRHVIQQQEQFIQDRLDCTDNDSMDSSMLRDSYLYDEYEALEHQHRILLHEQALMKEEKEYLSRAKEDLLRQQNALDEQTSIAKNQFFEITPFQNKHRNFTSIHKPRPRKQRLLPSTPRFSSSPGPIKTPSTAQLYKFLGLKQRSANFQDNSDSEDGQSIHEYMSSVNSIEKKLFTSPPPSENKNHAPSDSELNSPSSARIHEHVENIKMTLMHQRNKSPKD